jgi:hypothetical protein
MNCLINRAASLLSLKEYQTRIVPESDEDEGAAEFWGEIQSVIDVLDRGGTDVEVIEAARWVGLEECLKARGE